MKRPTFRLHEDKHRKLMSKLTLNGKSFQDFGEYVVNLYLNDEIQIKKESVKMKRNDMINEMAGNYMDVDYEWLKENDPEMIDWVCKSDFWGKGYDEIPERDRLWLRLHFSDNGVGYIATAADEVDVDHSLSEQPYWGENNWDDWDDIEQLTVYYNCYCC